MDGESTAAPAARAGTETDDTALAALRFGWGDAYEIGRDEEHGWWALRKDNLGGRITTDSPDELWQAIHQDYDLKAVPRDLPEDVAP